MLACGAVLTPLIGHADSPKLIDCVARLAQRHGAVILVDPAIEPEARTDTTCHASDEIARDLDALVATGPWRWERDEHDAYLVLPRRRALARGELDALLIVAPAASASASLATPHERGRSALAASDVDEAFAAELALEPDLGADRLGRRAPNVTGSGPTFAIRGIAREDAFSATSTVLLDGLPVSPLALDRDALDLFDIERVRYERGPASGRAGPFSLAGLVQLRSEPPEAERDAYSVLELDERGSTRGAAAIGGALDDEHRWPLRFAARRRLEALALDGSPMRGHTAGSVRVRRVPDASDDLVVDLVAHRIESAGPDDHIVPPAGSAPFDPFERRSFGEPRSDRLDGTLAGITATRAFGETTRAWLTASRTSFDAHREHASTRFDREHELDRDEANRASAWYEWHPDATWWLVGGVEYAQRELLASTTTATDLAVYYPPSVRIEPATVREFIASEADRLDTASLVLEATRRTAAFTASLALRLVDEQRQVDSLVAARLSPGDCRVTIGSSSVSCLAQFPDRTTAAHADSHDTIRLPSATLEGELGARAHWSLHYRSGYRSGGSRFDRTLNRSVPYRPERSDALEATLRWRSEDGRVHARLSTFAHRWTDRHERFATSDPGGFAIRNAGDARSHGGELEVEWRPDDAWTLSAGIGALATRYREFTLPGVGGTIDASGNEFPDAPKLTAAVAARWQGASGWYAGAHAWYSARAYSDPLESSVGERPAYAVVDARAGYRAEDWEAYVSVANAFDRDWLEDVELRGTSAVPRAYRVGEPRTFSVGFVRHW